MAKATLMDAFGAAAGFGNQVIGIADQLNKNAADAELERIGYEYNLQANEFMEQLRRSPSTDYAKIPEQYKKFQDSFYNNAQKQSKNGYTSRALESMNRNSEMQMMPQIQDLMMRKEVDYSVSQKGQTVQDISDNPGLSFQQKITEIENVWTDAHNRGYMSYERMNALIAKDTANAVLQHGVSTTDRKFEELEAYLNDPTRDVSQDSAYLNLMTQQISNEINNISVNDRTDANSLIMSMPGMNGGSVPRNMDMTEIKKIWNDYAQTKKNNIIASWQKVNGEIASDVWNKMNGLNPNEIGYIETYNAYAKMGNEFIEGLDSDHFTEEQQNAYSPRFKKKEHPKEGSGSIDDQLKYLEGVRFQILQDIDNGLGNAIVNKQRYMAAVDEIAKVFTNGTPEQMNVFKTIHSKRIDLNDFIPDAITMIKDRTEGSTADAFLPVNNYINNLLKGETDSETAYRLNKVLSFSTDYITDSLIDGGALTIEQVGQQAMSIAQRLIADDIAFARATSTGEAQMQDFDEKGFSQWLDFAENNPEMMLRNPENNMYTFAGNSATPEMAMEYGRDVLSEQLGVPLDEIKSSYEQEGAYDASALANYNVNGKNYRFVTIGESYKVQENINGKWEDSTEFTTREAANQRKWAESFVEEKEAVVARKDNVNREIARELKYYFEQRDLDPTYNTVTRSEIGPMLRYNSREELNRYIEKWLGENDE
jgi:hypothetical protein